MSAKIIILVRISTTRQEIETQRKELVELAVSDKWNKEDIIVIEQVFADNRRLDITETVMKHKRFYRKRYD